MQPDADVGFSAKAPISFDGVVRATGVAILLIGISLCYGVIQEAWRLYGDDSAVRARAAQVEAASQIDQALPAVLADMQAFVRTERASVAPQLARRPKAAGSGGAPLGEVPSPRSAAGSGTAPPDEDPQAPPKPPEDVPDGSGSERPAAATPETSQAADALETPVIGAGANPPTVTAWRPSYFVAWMLSLALLLLIGRLSFELISRGGELAMGGARDRRAGRELARELVAALPAQALDRAALAEVARQALAECQAARAGDSKRL